MAKRIKYIIRAKGEIAKFSDHGQALLYAAVMSVHLPGHLIEVNAKDGLVGQYQNGKPTPEFEIHHMAAQTREAAERAVRRMQRENNN